MKTRGLWLGASVIAFAWSSQVSAQSAPPGSDAIASADKSADEIVVTAQRRNENLMKTPIAASVLTGQDLANKGVVNVDQLQFAMPSVTVNNFGQGLEFNIRGIGKAEHNTQTTTGVITYRDGISTFPGYFQEEPYFDITSVQVLRGPQGTIAGQNSTGGAVFVTTNDPNPKGGYSGYLQAQVGNYADAGLQGAINLPISKTLTARLAFYGERRDGFYHITGPGGAKYTGNNGDLREGAVRFSLLWQPTEHLSILSKTDYDNLNMGAYPADPYTDRFKTLPGTSTPNPNHRDLFDITANSPQQAHDRFVRSLVKVEYDVDSGIKLRSLTGYQAGNTRYRADLDGTATGNSTFYDSVDEHLFTQEFNIVSPDDARFTWLLGSYAQWDKYIFKAPFQFLIGTPAGNPLTEYRLQGTNPERSLAVFGQVGFQLTPKLKVEVGGRYTDSRTTNHVDVLQYGAAIPDEQTDKSHNFSYKASLGWAVDSDNYFYGFVATGFRPGGLNVPVGIGQPAPFEGEKVTSFEGGWKANFLGGHVKTTIDGFYNNYKNFQVIIGYPQFPTFGIELNVPDTTKIYGLEADADAKFGNFSFDFGVSVLHSSLGQFYATDPRVPSVLPCTPNAGPASVTCINLKGRDQTYAPNFTFNVAAAYEFTLKNSDTITPRVNFGHIGPQWATLFENPLLGDRLENRNILGAQLAWAHSGWVATAFATNLTNQHYVGALQSNLDFAGPPRQYGLKLLKIF